MTKNQLKVYNFYKKYILENEICPSFDEVALAIGIKSKSHVYTIVNALIKKDYLKKIGKYGDARRIIINRDYQKGGIKIGKTGS